MFDDVASAYITHDYVLDGSKILSETVTDAAYGNSYTLYYVYDANGSITGLHYNGTPYYFQKNIQGDVLRICNASGAVVVEYTYDAWGNILSVTGSMASTLGQYNPFRYRGYYYDSETDLYYLNSRYYDAEVGRFISAEPNVFASGFDEGAGLIGYNVYAYCANNPVMYRDDTGEGVTAVCMIVFGVVFAALGGYGAYRLAKYYNVQKKDIWKYVLGGIVIGGATGVMLGWGAGGLVTAAAAKSASIALFSKRVATSATMVIQLLKKFYEKSKTPMDVTKVKQLITLCKRYGVEIYAKIGDLVNVQNHKSWNGIPHIHVGDARIHVALTEEAVEYIRKVLGI